MSAVIREVSQIGVRNKYYLAITSTTYYLPDEDYKFSAIMKDVDFNNHTSDESIGGGGGSSTQYRDLGKQVITVDSNNRHVAKYRLVQRVRGAASEGVYNDWEYDSYYIRVWAADPVNYPITVVRTG